MQDGCKAYMDSYMASNGSCFMTTWTVFKNHLLEVGLTQNRETMALRTLTTVGFFYFIMHEDPASIEMHRNSIWLRARSHMTSHYNLRVRDHATWLWRCLGTAFGHFLLGSHKRFHGHGSWLVCEVAFWPPSLESSNGSTTLRQTKSWVIL